MNGRFGSPGGENTIDLLQSSEDISFSGRGWLNMLVTYMITQHAAWLNPLETKKLSKL